MKLCKEWKLGRKERSIFRSLPWHKDGMILEMMVMEFVLLFVHASGYIGKNFSFGAEHDYLWRSLQNPYNSLILCNSGVSATKS